MATAGLASPLCDSLLLAAAAHLAKRAVCPNGADGASAGGSGPVAVLGGIFGVGCDGELTPAEVFERLAEVAAAGGFAGARGLTPPIAARLAEAVDAVPTEARCRRSAASTAPSARRPSARAAAPWSFSPAGALTFYFDVAKTIWSAARLAASVVDARDLYHANELLHERGVRTELDYERDALHTVRPPSN